MLSNAAYEGLDVVDHDAVLDAVAGEPGLHPRHLVPGHHQVSGPA